MKVYKIKYWYAGNKCVSKIKANDVDEALYKFYMSNYDADIISIELDGEE